MYCTSCAAEVPAGARFCPACAAAVASPPEAGPDDRTALAPETPTPASHPSSGHRPPTSTSRLASAPALDGSRFLPGTLIAERYRVVGVLGRGGMGEVYRADDLKLGQPVALKFLPGAVERDPEWLDRFLNEVKIARQVSNPNVCRVYDVGEVDGHHFLSMEYIDGEDLGSLLRRIGRLPEDKAVQLARQLCAGLAAAHDQGVLHRDLKPANVMIDGRGNARLTDFGLAGLAETLADDVGSGTPAFMAPEQLAGREVSVRSDLYALGLVLYELFTGKRAWQASSAAELSKLQQESSPTSPSSLVDGLDPAVERVILRCLETDPARRPRSALEVSAALPGGDPLAAALAAGETPSPEMVAAAGEEGVLKPKAALALAVVAALLALAALALADRNQLPNQLPLALPPEVLEHQARQALERLGADPEDVTDSAWGFDYDYDLRRHLDSEWQGQSEPWQAVRNGRPALLHFWYRQSRRQLMPLRNSPSVVSWGEPPYESSGMASVRLDTAGRLLEYLRVPPQLESSEAAAEGASAAAPGEPDWAELFELAELEMAAFAPAAPTWVPAVYADRRAAWTGSFPGLDGAEARVEAAAYRGEPVYFELLGPWSRASRQVSVQRSARSRANQIVVLSLLVLVLVGSGLVARRNLRAGRGDRRGALRIALTLLALNVGAWALLSHHVPSLTGEIILVVFSLGVPLFVSAVTWLLYIALEPYLRRSKPHWLVSWSRLLGGRHRDPLVGRDVLIGVAVGAGLAFLGEVGYQLSLWLEPAATRPPPVVLEPMHGLGNAVGWMLSSVQGSTFVAMALIFVWFLFRLVLRSDRIAAGAMVALLTFTSSAGASSLSWVGVALAALTALLLVLVAGRFGLLVLITGLVSGTAMANIPISLELAAWWARGSWLCLLAVLLLAAWAFHAALGGRKVLAEP